MQSTKLKLVPQIAGLASLSIIAISMSFLPLAKAVEFPDAGDRGAPARTTGGGTRGEWCDDASMWSSWSARALVPNNNVSTFSSEQAALWLYVTENFNQKTAEIYVKDPVNNEAIYEQKILLEGLEHNNLVKIELPKNNDAGTPLLETGKDYHWEFSIICDANNRAQDYVLQGLFHRMEATTNSAETLPAAPSPQQVEQYASAGLWQETLQAAAALKAEQPHLWTELLSSVGLNTLTPLLSPAPTPEGELSYESTGHESTGYESTGYESTGYESTGSINNR